MLFSVEGVLAYTALLGPGRFLYFFR